MLLIQNLSLIVLKQILFQNLNISILPSTILYIKGDNGSGKTSLLRAIAGILKPLGGEIILNNKSIYHHSKPYCLYLGHNNGFKNDFTILESLKFWASIYNSLELISSTIQYFNLHEILDKKYYQLSEGNKRKVMIAKLLACNSNLWLLDEVDNNLDEFNLNLLNQLIIAKANNGGIVLISTHNKILITTAQTLNLKDFQYA